MNTDGASWVFAGYGILALDQLLSGSGWSPKTAIGAIIAALATASLGGNGNIGVRIGQVYFVTVALYHGTHLLEMTKSTPDTLPSSKGSK